MSIASAHDFDAAEKCPLARARWNAGMALGWRAAYGNGFPSTRTGAWMSQMPTLPTGVG
jgi:hypothetical protein